jgi:hypothetical protein
VCWKGLGHDRECRGQVVKGAANGCDGEGIVGAQNADQFTLCGPARQDVYEQCASGCGHVCSYCQNRGVVCELKVLKDGVVGGEEVLKYVRHVCSGELG